MGNLNKHTNVCSKANFQTKISFSDCDIIHRLDYNHKFDTYDCSSRVAEEERWKKEIKEV